MRWAVILFALALVTPAALGQPMSDDDVRQMIIDNSIRGYHGNCPCPYNRAANGSRCGKRSAYSRPGGAQPICYPADVSDAMVEDYKRRHGLVK